MPFPPIAIVGRACVIPGALSPQQLWDVVAQGRDLVSAVEPGRWRTEPDDTRCGPDDDPTDRAWTDRGGYVRGFEEVWDPSGFAVPPEDLAGLDPLFWWVLHCAREALGDAGDRRRGAVPRPRVRAVLGNLGFPTAEMNRYAESVWLGASAEPEPAPDPRNRFMSSGPAALLEQALGLSAGAFCLDGACASSLYAIAIACAQLHDGEADLVLAGAANRADDLFLHVGFCALKALSRTGRSRPFHAQADGLLPAEGAGVVALKRLDHARRDGDRIHGVIRGVGLSNDGRGRGFLAPSVEGQSRALRAAYDGAGIDPQDVSLLECHATGTVLGDATELRSTAAVFEGCGQVPIGSLKSNLGHLITAAGVAGLLKVLEAMRNEQRPASLHVDEPTPALDGSPFRVLTRPEPWPADRIRVAGISAFGFGGNNAHLIVSEEHPSIDAAAPRPAPATALAVVGVGTIVGEAADAEALERAARQGLCLIRPPSDDGHPGGARIESLSIPLAGLCFPPRDLRRTIAQQLLVLGTAREATASASSLPRDRTGIYVGMETDPEVCRYGLRWRLRHHLRLAALSPPPGWLAATRDAIAPPLGAEEVVGTMPNIPANRINRQLDLGGPSYSVSAGEASGRVALELAARALAHRELDAALVGAVDLSCQPVHLAARRATGAEPAEPAPPGDAAVTLVLRRLDDALADGDPVLAVIEPAADSRPAERVPDRSDRLGRCWAAGDLRDLAAAVLTARASETARPMSIPPRPGGRAFVLRPAPAGARTSPARPTPLYRFAATSPADLEARLVAREPGGQGPCRAAILADDDAALRQRCDRARSLLSRGEGAAPGVFVRSRPIEGELAFVFAGAGAAYPGSGAALRRALPQLEAPLRERCPELARQFDRPWAPDDHAPPLQRLWSSSYLSQLHAQLTRTMLELRPDAVIGYSSGESNALFAAGIWSDHDAMIEQCRTSGIFTEQIGGRLDAVSRAWGRPARWETWTVLGDVDRIITAADPRPRVHVSIVHHDRECVVAGEPEACAALRERLEATRWIRLRYDLAVHVPELSQIAEPWRALHRRPVTPPPADLRVYSAAHAGAYEPSEAACAEAILGQADRRLDVRAVIEQAYADGVRVFVEHGPRDGVSRWIRTILGPRDAVVVALDRKGAGLDALIEAAAALWSASVPIALDALLDALAPAPRPRDVGSLRLAAHPPPLRLDLPQPGASAAAPPAPGPIAPEDSVVSSTSSAPPEARPPAPSAFAPATAEAPPAQAMPPAPPLPAVGSIPPPLPPLGTASIAASDAASPPAPAPIPATAATSGPAPGFTVLDVLRSQLVQITERQQAFVAQQAALHRQFLGARAHASALLVAASARHRSAPDGGPPPSALNPATLNPASLTPATLTPTATASTSSPSGTPPTLTETATAVPRSSIATRSGPTSIPPTADPSSSPGSTPASRPSSPPLASTSTPTPDLPAPRSIPAPVGAPPAPRGPTFDRAALEIHAGGAISTIYGEAFAVQDGFARQVRMPLPPLLLADRVTGLDAEPMSMGRGTIWTETDVTEDAWYLHAGHMPAGIMIESGQADLMLISYMGVDAHNRGERIYRLLGCTLTYHGGLPRVGETLRFDIHIDGHARQGQTRLMFFHYDCHIDGEVRLSVRQGQAGFFTDAELADSDGCLWRPEEQSIVPDPQLDPPLHPTPRAFDAAKVRAFAEGRPWECFGDAWVRTRSHTRPPRIQAGRMQLLHQVDRFEPRGGPWDRGYLQATRPITPDDWFFEGHFKNDPCMPGTLMFEGCLQALAFYLAGLGYTIDRDGWRFEPVPGEPMTLSCRGQVTPASRQLTYEVFVEEVCAGPIPTIHADLLCTVDGLKAFHARRVGLRLVPAWPMDDDPPRQGRAGARGSAAASGRPAASAGAFTFDRAAMLACASGRPTAAFGPMYARFDGPEPVPRLPNPPYHFISRATHIEGNAGEMRQGGLVEVELDVDPDAWYFAENGSRTMPFAVLLEAALQPCGWLASYMGCALSVDQPLMFRNLDGTGTQHREVGPDAGVLRTRARNTQLSVTASMIIVGFDVECRVGDDLVYAMQTVFGFFPASAFEDQAGLPTTEPQRALLEARGSEASPRPLDADAPRRPRLAAPMLMMLDRVVHFDPRGGAASLGCARGDKDVDPGEWFFKAHFFQDPVQPGSLGIEAMLQLLQWCMRELRLDEGFNAPRFEPLALGQPLTWKYRGQVVPTDRRISTTLEITDRGTDERGAYAVADASLWIDGKRIYHATGVGMRIVEGGAEYGRTLPLSTQAQPWLLDHRPTWTVPAMPMMSMVDLLAHAARADERVVGLRDVRVKGWLTVPPGPARTLRLERERDDVTLVLEDDDGRRPIATGRLVLGRSGDRPDPLPPLRGPASPLPYDDGAIFHGPAFQLMERLVRTADGASSVLRVGRDVPGGRMAPALLDAATHGIPHDALHRWDPRIPADRVAYPAWIPELDVYGPPPSEGTLRCEVRYRGPVGRADFPSFLIQLIGERGVWCQLVLVEACFPKGRLGSAPPAERRAFLRDRQHVPGLALSRVSGDRARLSDEEVAGSDWLPGTIAAIYGTTRTEDIARKEYVGAAHRLHPRHLPDALPLTAWSLSTRREGAGVVVEGDPHGTLDLDLVRAFWSRWLGKEGWPVEDLYYGLIERFLRRVVVTDPEAFAALRGRGAIFLANHQVGVESLVFSIVASALIERPTITLAKAEHRGSWLGTLIEHCFSYPDTRDPELIAFFERSDPASLSGVLERLRARVDDGCSMMVHVEGTRSRTCAEPVRAISGAFLDLALALRVPVVPVRFVGGLPRESLEQRLEFPLGMGQQDIWFGRPLLPDSLAALTYAERRQAVVDAINALGPGAAHEQPLPGDAAFERAVTQWQRDRGIGRAHATLYRVLAEQARPSAPIRALLEAPDAAALASDASPEGRWLHQLARWLLG